MPPGSDSLQDTRMFPRSILPFLYYVYEAAARRPFYIFLAAGLYSDRQNRILHIHAAFQKVNTRISIHTVHRLIHSRRA